MLYTVQLRSIYVESFPTCRADKAPGNSPLWSNSTIRTDNVTQSINKERNVHLPKGGLLRKA